MPDRVSAGEADVCIVGSGAGGGPAALALARAGVSVVVLEKGPWYTRKDFARDEIASCRRNMWAPFVADDPHVLVVDGGAPKKSADGWIAHCVGGGTVHMSGFFHRLQPEDFRMATLYGGGGRGPQGAALADWPLSYDDLMPWYDLVEREIGVSGLAGQHPRCPRRTAPYPLAPLLENPLSRLVDEGARKLGYHPFQTPRAIVSAEFAGRPACQYCELCGSYGCQSGARSSALEAVLPQAIATGRCEVRPGSMAFEIATGKDGRATAVRYYDSAGVAREQKARVVVVSATAVESARLLLNSVSPAHKDGLANASGLVGRNLTFSTLGKAWGQWSRDRLPPDLRETHRIHFLNRSIQDLYRIPALAGGYDKGGTLSFLLPHRNPIHTAERLSRRASPPLFGQPLKDAVARSLTEFQELEVEVFAEFLPTEATRVAIDPEVRDRWGVPSARISVAHHPDDTVRCQHLVDAALAVFDAAGAGRTGTETVGGTTYILQHGTCRFGNDARTSVLTPDCRAWSCPNLYVVDGSFMPTSGGVPTTWTIMANAFRVADSLVRRFRSRSL